MAASTTEFVPKTFLHVPLTHEEIEHLTTKLAKFAFDDSSEPSMYILRDMVKASQQSYAQGRFIIQTLAQQHNKTSGLVHQGKRMAYYVLTTPFEHWNATLRTIMLEFAAIVMLEKAYHMDATSQDVASKSVHYEHLKETVKAAMADGTIDALVSAVSEKETFAKDCMRRAKDDYARLQTSFEALQTQLDAIRQKLVQGTHVIETLESQAKDAAKETAQLKAMYESLKAASSL